MEQLSTDMKKVDVADVKDARKPGDYISASEGKAILSHSGFQTSLTS